MKRLLAAVLPFIGFLVFFAGAMRLQHEIIRKEQAKPNRFYDMLYLPSSRSVQLAATDYDHFLADFFFLRVIQAFGASYSNAQSLGQLWAYFDSITDLDPHFLAAYSFGNMVLGEEQQDQEKGLAILDKGIEKNPETYRLAFEAAFYCLWMLQDPELARKYVRLAEQAPDAPEFVARWEGFIDEQMGRYHAAVQQFLAQYIRALNQNEETLIAVNFRRLQSAVDQWNKAVLLDEAIAYQEKNGFYPLIEDLEDDGELLDAELLDWNGLMDYLDQAIESGQELETSETAIAELADRFTRKGWLKMPDNPSGHPEFSGYLIWPGQEPMFDNGRENRTFLGSELNVAFAVRDEIVRAALNIHAYREANEGQCPQDLESVSPAMSTLLEPWGGEFILDTEACYVYSSTYPQLAKMLDGYRRL